MITKDEVLNRFFSRDLKLYEEVNLTEEEVGLFEAFEWAILCDNGLRQINGGWSAIEILSIDEDDETGNPILICKGSCGVQDEDGKELNEWQIIFDRVTKKFNRRF